MNYEEDFENGWLASSAAVRDKGYISPPLRYSRNSECQVEVKGIGFALA